MFDKVRLYISINQGIPPFCKYTKEISEIIILELLTNTGQLSEKFYYTDYTGS